MSKRSQYACLENEVIAIGACVSRQRSDSDAKDQSLLFVQDLGDASPCAVHSLLAPELYSSPWTCRFLPALGLKPTAFLGAGRK